MNVSVSILVINFCQKLTLTEMLQATPELQGHQAPWDLLDPLGCPGIQGPVGLKACREIRAHPGRQDLSGLQGLRGLQGALGRMGPLDLKGLRAAVAGLDRPGARDQRASLASLEPRAQVVLWGLSGLADLKVSRVLR